MKPRKQRIVLVSMMLVGLAIAAFLLTKAFNSNIQLFLTPSDINAGKVEKGNLFRLGGLVVIGSVTRPDDTSLKVRFDLTDNPTDNTNNVTVEYEGILPDLFTEGQGIVTQGRLDDDGIFKAIEVLAKHDENYMSPELKKKLEETGVTHKTNKP